MKRTVFRIKRGDLYLRTDGRGRYSWYPFPDHQKPFEIIATFDSLSKAEQFADDYDGKVEPYVTEVIPL